MNIGILGFLVTVQFLLTMLLYPIKIGAMGHISLAYDKIDANVTLFGFAVARLRIKREDGRFNMYVNGKMAKPKNKITMSQVKNVAERYRLEGLKVRGNVLALIGTQDARTTAMLCAGLHGILGPLLNGSVYTAAPADTLEIDGRLKLKISILQAISLIVAGSKKDKRSKRYIKQAAEG